ncbi:NADH-quinone oxidoreductase subunit NuoH [Tuwongella immobilis]|uniref:NADH-quinone oxidoreductase subunit H n=1 Tax=Tuwongella immobilis TaxID=692036 RepID=A0A6C2YH93_9BACT|nr:NADH-quinone oxidoreductase subunit NuoH [Tuwongella immobilis]VIP00898.1 nadh:ubiquinone oxidoreductase subunit h : NADH-quinone oxidoreductase subunit H OS=Singulisphaera acidiphila (strain ATCC BAA-1392 / DSM 18658 / VKM B-2454 / MOB10) GN=nuoH PE=3 SV=1: NADHdh: NADHdh [Tuwongella immobilis]VTR97214.1 nadh:ubiquinone oxidoreductase subunit h : NADH-quinone oxidoreductase subunit H OS=Singulisphaera acidiphila (strain ATCC BAA-1392 / DSM 18658 / VKM B-2454 / MOB10) GN=nuoH PE=3 SV=1: NADHdh
MPSFSLLFTLFIIAVVMGVILNTVAYLIYVERKISAYMQERIGPNRVGPFGLIQPLVDGAKMFLKEDIIPKHVDRVFYLLAPGVAAATALFAFVVVPFGPTTPPPAPVVVTAEMTPAEAVNAFNKTQEAYQSQTSYVIAPGINIGMLFTFAIGSLAVYGIILGGWSAGSKYAFLGALRSSAQIISYEIPLGLSILGVVLLIGSFNLETVINWQTQHGWMVLYQPLAFLIFLTAVFAECNRLPFDLPEAEQELVGGYHTEYSSLKFGLFYLGEYTHMITTSALASIVFFGGWHMPFVSEWVTPGSLADIAIKFAALMGKITFFILFYMLVRWTIPRFRFDQLMGLAWQVMVPLATLNILCVMLVREFLMPESFNSNGWILTAASFGLFAISALISTTATPGRRMPARKPTPQVPAGV